VIFSGGGAGEVGGVFGEELLLEGVDWQGEGH